MDIRVSAAPASEAAVDIASQLRSAVGQRGTATIAFSGGGTAPPMLATLVDVGIVGQLPWDRITVFQVDERVVGDDHPDRNAHQLADFPADVTLMPVTDPDRRAAARRYGEALPERLDIVHLGVGDDGHTASWPPGDLAIADSDLAVELVPPFRGHRRMTLTARVVNAARCRIVLATGASKAPVISRWLDGDASFPISKVTGHDTLVFIDPAAESVFEEKR